MNRPHLPPSVVETDLALHRLFERVVFSRYLNPLNSRDAQADFALGEPPRYRYQPADWADDELRALDALRPPEDHPFGPLLRRAIEGTRLFILALRDRDPARFDALARHSGWYPDAETLHAARNEPREHERSAQTVTAYEMADALQAAIRERGLAGWRVELDPVMAARVLVDGAHRVVRVTPHAAFRASDIPRLIAHEIDVHVRRAENGYQQPLRLFATGLPESLETEEGLALYAEERAGVISPGTSWRQGVVVQAVHWGRSLGFRALHERITSIGGGGLAWTITERLKRGLADPEAPGVYAKDVVYYTGLRKVRAYLAAGRPLEHLFVGKVSVDDPVGAWIDAGLVTVQPTPGVLG
ncbi:MAG: DUF1704 domain-containing protein [Deltaproteobacteria bacterium]|nr:DUF1704 domain-containing protein [Deltaproteobacteria bacterium]